MPLPHIAILPSAYLVIPHPHMIPRYHFSKFNFVSFKNKFRYDDNATVIIDQKGNPKGTRVFGAIAEELRELTFTKIVSFAPVVL